MALVRLIQKRHNRCRYFNRCPGAKNLIEHAQMEVAGTASGGENTNG